MFVQIPNSSQFPEIDFASKCFQSRSNISSRPSPIHELLFPLGNANSRDVRKRLRDTLFFVGAGDGGRDSIQHVMLTTQEPSEGVAKGERYI